MYSPWQGRQTACVFNLALDVSGMTSVSTYNCLGRDCALKPAEGTDTLVSQKIISLQAYLGAC